MRRIAVVCVAVLAAFAMFASAGEDANSATYSKVIDNSDKKRFAASRSWKKSDEGKGINGRDYLLAQPAKKGGHALFEVAIPTNGVYAVYVRWPEMRGLNDRTPVGVESAYGTKWTEVDQRKDGGRWVRLGEFEMRKDEKFPIRISHNTKGKGKIAADAVKVEMISSYEQSATATRAESATSSEGTRTASATGSSVVTKARSYLNIRYRYATCTTTLMSCTCLTKKTFAAFGHTLPMTESGQYAYGTKYGVAVAKSNLRPGDIVFFRETGGPITHVGIYSGINRYTGQRMIVHSSSYFGKVVEREMRWIQGYAGARRLPLR